MNKSWQKMIYEHEKTMRERQLRQVVYDIVMLVVMLLFIITLNIIIKYGFDTVALELVITLYAIINIFMLVNVYGLYTNIKKYLILKLDLEQHEAEYLYKTL